MKDLLLRYGIILIVVFQLGVYALRLTDPFVDGRMHLNWGPPFWLMKAQLMHEVNFASALFGVVSEIVDTPEGKIATSWYISHPQFIAIPLYLWTAVFGFAEWSVRSLTGLITIVTTVLWYFALRARHTAREALLATIFFAALPIIFVFGRKLDQEPLVLFFIILAAFAHERFFLTQKKRNIALWFTAIVGMVWSDWSGFVISGLFILLFAIVSYYHKQSRIFVKSTVAAGVTGAAIVITQLFLASRSIDVAQHTLSSLYAYRSSSSTPFFWMMWIKKQLGYFSTNYGGVIGYTGLIGFFIKTRLRDWSARQTFCDGTQLKHLIACAVFGCFIYAVFLPQATYVHLYYQYFYAPAVAYGLMYLFFYCTAFIKKNNARIAFSAITLLTIFGFLVYTGFNTLYTDVRLGFGWTGEINLVQYIGTHTTSPSDKTAIITNNPHIISWIGNPNIVYYAGRGVEVLQEPNMRMDYRFIMVSNQHINQRLELLNQLTNGKKYSVVNCARHLCLLELK